jgi:REP-associated tyrosine transposase
MSHDGHLMIATPRYAVLQEIGYIKSNSVTHLSRDYEEEKRNFVGWHFWARGTFVSTVGWREAVVRKYIGRREQGE